MSFLTANQMNTTVAKRIKANFEKEAEKKQAKFKKEQDRAKKKARDKAKKAPRRKPKKKLSPEEKEAERKKKAQQKKDDQDHMDATSMPGGVLAKDSRYAIRGRAYIKANSGGSGGDLRGGVYNHVANRPHLKRIAKIAAKATFHDPANDQNFNAAYTQSYPYVWEAHHIIPGSAYYYVDSGGQPCFDPKQREAILRSDYNLNDGHNIIMLPTEAWAVPVHELPQHPSDHVKYTQKVMKKLKRVANAIEKVAAKHPKKLPAATKRELWDTENELWEFLVNLGKASISKVLEGTTFVDDDGDFVDIARKYKWGRLA